MAYEATRSFAADGQPEGEGGQTPSRSQVDLKIMLSSIIARLQAEADDRVNKRNPTEQRWLQDIRQYYGQYEQAIVTDLRNGKGSQLFVNQTRTKTNACEAKLSDMLFPTDDKNWGISPTPVPSLTEQSEQAVNQAKALAQQANEAMQTGQDPKPIVEQGNQVAQLAVQAKARMDEAQRACIGMEKEIDDQLVECQYAIQMRDVIRDACRVGTGVSKGPIASEDRSRRAWSKKMVQGVDPTTGQSTTTEVYELNQQRDHRPAIKHVDHWAIFPDPDVAEAKDSASWFERHLMNKKALRRLAKQPDFDQDAIRELLRAEPSQTLPTYIADLRSISSAFQTPTTGLYVVWEYRGPLECEDLQTICDYMGNEKGAKLKELHAEIDPLTEIQVVIWFCQGELLKFGIHHLDSDECIYSFYCLEKDDSSPWGFGIPWAMRDSQSAMNGGWRMMMDNAGLSSGPQIVVDRSVVEPEDGDWTLRPRKVWTLKSNQAGKEPFKVYDIKCNQEQLASIIELSKQFIDDETSISVLAQGEQGTHTTQTSSGMALLMNAVNVVFRRFVKNFDDDITTPNIRRLYDWNMQFNPKSEIKGDYDVEAKGTSVLLVREVQSQNLMILANMTAHPVLGVLLKGANLLRKLVQSMMIPADDVVATDDEIKQKIAAEQANPPKDPAQAEAEAKMALIQAETQGKLDIAKYQRETELMKLAQTHNMSLDELRTRLEMKDKDIASAERKLAVEAAITAKQPAGEQHGGGSL